MPIQEAYRRKFERQDRIKELEYHAGGHCVHIGKLSPGCYSCFVPDRFKSNLFSGAKCNLDCVYCFDKQKEPPKERMIRQVAEILRDSRLPDYALNSVSFTGGGEPLLYMDVISEYMRVFRDIEKDTKKKPWYHLYTNGCLADSDMLLRLKDLGFDEVRFHLGASNFSKKVYRNLGEAVRHFKAVTVETPSWPPHREKLFEMLSIIDGLGVKHLNLGEIEISRQNYKRVAKVLPEGVMYQCYEMHLYDGGLVYDIIEEVLRKKYSYSVLDCNCFVKTMQRGPAKWIAHQEVKDLCARYCKG